MKYLLTNNGTVDSIVSLEVCFYKLTCHVNWLTGLAGILTITNYQSIIFCITYVANNIYSQSLYINISLKYNEPVNVGIYL